MSDNFFEPVAMQRGVVEALLELLRFSVKSTAKHSEDMSYEEWVERQRLLYKLVEKIEYQLENGYNGVGGENSI